MSQLECKYFYILEWCENVIDIREQYPLHPQAVTLEIAERCGIVHPTDPKTRQPIIVTTDFLITVRTRTGTAEYARAVKPASALTKPRIVEKLEIERVYWSVRGVDWKIVTEQDIPDTLASNIAVLRRYYSIVDRIRLTTCEVNGVAKILTRRLLDTDSNLKRLTAACDIELGLDPGTCLTIAFHLIMTRQWRIDMYKPLNPAERLEILSGGNTDLLR